MRGRGRGRGRYIATAGARVRRGVGWKSGGGMKMGGGEGRSGGRGERGFEEDLIASTSTGGFFDGGNRDSGRGAEERKGHGWWGIEELRVLRGEPDASGRKDGGAGGRSWMVGSGEVGRRRRGVGKREKGCWVRCLGGVGSLIGGV